MQSYRIGLPLSVMAVLVTAIHAWQQKDGQVVDGRDFARPGRVEAE
jgi:hypothetical protein